MLLVSAGCGTSGGSTDGGSAGDAGPSGDAGAQSDAGPQGDGGATSSAVDGILQVCKLVDACGYSTAQFGTAADLCVDRNLGLLAQGVEMDSPENRVHYARMISCAASATSCDAFIRCSDFDTPCNGSATPSCSGDIALRCSTPGGNYLPRIFDCATVGQTCNGGVCQLPAGADECSSPGTARCDGTTRVWCRPRAGGGNGEVREPCPAGSFCLGSGQDAACYPLTPCTTKGFRCDGDTIAICSDQYVQGMTLESREDCTAIGRHCVNVQCVPNATQCMADPHGASTTRCSGTSIQACLNGTTAQIDCAALGRTSCAMVTPPGGVGPAYAGCQ